MKSRPQDEFARVFIENQGRLYAYVATLLPNRDDAEEVFQRTSLIMWQKWETFETDRPFLPWARGIALNEVRNLLRRSDRRNVHLSEPILTKLADHVEQQDDQSSRTDALATCLEQLEPKQLHLLERCYLGTSGIKAVAEGMGLQVTALYMRLYRIRKSLVECIGRRLAGEVS